MALGTLLACRPTTAAKNGTAAVVNIAGRELAGAAITKAETVITRSITTNIAKSTAQKTSLTAERYIVKGGEETFNRAISFAGSRRSPFDYAPYQRIRNTSTNINGRKYCGHALDRMQDRGFMPSVIENAIETGYVSPTKIPGRLQYFDPVNNLRVILKDNNEVITIIPKRSK